MSTVDGDVRLNLSKAHVLIMDGSQHALDVTAQILKGFGVATVSRFDCVEDAQKFVSAKTIDLIVIDPSVADGAGYDFISSLRHSGGQNAFVPVILLCGYVRKADVKRAVNLGANFVITKPIAPAILLQRILWVARDKRSFVEVGSYIGPDRRIRFDGVPEGTSGRRHDDLSTPLGDATEPNLSQDEVSAFIKPQRVII